VPRSSSTRGHVISVVFDFTIADVTTSTILDFESQRSETCTESTPIRISRRVSADDEILFTLDVTAILKQ
jgi:hypothetical protein